LVPNRECRADSATRVAGCRLHVDALKSSRASYLPVSHRVHRAAAGQSNVGETGTSLQRPDQIEECLFVHGLHRASDVAMPIQQWMFGAATRAQKLFERRREQIAEFRRPGRPLICNRFPVMAKILQIELETVFQSDDLP